MLRVALVVVLFAIGALAAPYCANVTRDELSFCFAVDYKVYFGDGETPTQLDRLAQTLYLGQHDFGIEGGCNTEARDLICANIFRQCNETTADTPLPTSLRPCRKLCKDFKSCFKVEGDCDEFTYEEVEGECTNVKSDASVARVAFLAIVAVFVALMW